VAIALKMQYADLNRPQTITAPTKLRPYSQFQARLRVLVQDVGNRVLSSGASATQGG
jgi:translation elongation factor EF-Tu-like GTPase